MQRVTNPDAWRRDVLDCKGTEQWNRRLAVQYELGRAIVAPRARPQLSTNASTHSSPAAPSQKIWLLVVPRRTGASSPT